MRAISIRVNLWISGLYRCFVSADTVTQRSVVSLVFVDVRILVVSVLTDAIDHGFN